MTKIHRSARPALTLLCVATLLAACGGGDNSSGRGGLLSLPASVTTITKGQTDAATTASGLAALAGPATCDVKVNSIEYNTLGGKGEVTNATAAVMVPTGTAAACTGARPILLYAHGTTTDKTKNLTRVTTDGEASLLMAVYAAQGFVVVAPNYTGYDKSTLPYHPYLNADAQAIDMIDAVRATKQGQGSLGVTLSNKLFITGYSQGGHVAMATHRAIQQSYAGELTVTASAPMSGPYALAKMSAAVFAGQQNIGAAIFTPMVIDSYQNSYGNLYTKANELYESPFDTTIPGLLPTADPTALAKVPAGTDGTYRTLFDAGDGKPFLIKNSYRTAMASQGAAHPLNADTARNDLLNWKPSSPVALCWGAQDPTVFYFNSTDAQAYFASVGVTVTPFDLENAATVPPTVKAGFDGAKAAASAAAGGGANGAAAVIGKYHGELVPPFCNALVRGFFQTILASAP